MIEYDHYPKQCEPQSAVRQAEVIRCVSDLGSCAERLHEATKRLVDRLTPVLSYPAPANTERMPDKPRSPVCPLGESLDRMGGGLREVAEMIEDILRRLEV